MCLLGADSRIGMPGELLLEKEGDALLFATFVAQRNLVARAVWAVTEPVHVRVVRDVLGQASRAAPSLNQGVGAGRLRGRRECGCAGRVAAAARARLAGVGLSSGARPVGGGVSWRCGAGPPSGSRPFPAAAPRSAFIGRCVRSSSASRPLTSCVCTACHRSRRYPRVRGWPRRVECRWCPAAGSRGSTGVARRRAEPADRAAAAWTVPSGAGPSAAGAGIGAGVGIAGSAGATAGAAGRHYGRCGRGRRRRVQERERDGRCRGGRGNGRHRVSGHRGCSDRHHGFGLRRVGERGRRTQGQRRDDSQRPRTTVSAVALLSILTDAPFPLPP